MRSFANDTPQNIKMSKAGPSAVMRYLKPYMWPEERPDLRFFVVVAFFLTIFSKLVTVLVPYAFKWSTDALSGNETPFSHLTNADPLMVAIATPIGLIIIYGIVRVGMVGLAQIRDALFGRVGQFAVRKLSNEVFQHLHALSLRFHLQRRTGGLSRIIDRGKVGIEIIVRMLMINGVPTIIEFLLMLIVLTYQFDIRYALVALITIVAYIIFTFIVS